MRLNHKTIKFVYIVNTKLGRGKAKHVVSLIRDFNESRGLNYKIEYTEYPQHATILAEKSVSDGVEVVVAVGGDGTAHEVANALIGSSTSLGIVPCGSGNDFPKSVNIPLGINESLNSILELNIREVDAGKHKDKYFINGIGIGMDGAVSHRFKKYRLIRGQVAYLWGAVLEAFVFTGFRAFVELPDWKYNGQVLLAGAANGSYHGGKFKLAPGAIVDDGMLEVYVIKDMPVVSRLFKIPKVLTGDHQYLEEVYLKKSPVLEITVESPVKAHMDGEPFVLDPGYHKIEIIQKALRVISSNY